VSSPGTSPGKLAQRRCADADEGGAWGHRPPGVMGPRRAGIQTEKPAQRASAAVRAGGRSVSASRIPADPLGMTGLNGRRAVAPRRCCAAWTGATRARRARRPSWSRAGRRSAWPTRWSCCRPRSPTRRCPAAPRAARLASCLPAVCAPVVAAHSHTIFAAVRARPAAAVLAHLNARGQLNRRQIYQQVIGKQACVSVVGSSHANPMLGGPSPGTSAPC